MDMKTIPLRVKSAGPDDGLAEGEFMGYASVFGNVDSGGDMVVKGAFADSLKEWEDSGSALPILWGHDMQDPFANIGSAKSAVEDDHGLLIHGQLDLENPKALQVYRLLKGRRVSQMSFAYDVTDGAYVGAKSSDEDGYYEIRGAKIYEVSVVPIGMNQATSIEAVKSAALKAGRTLSAKNEQALREAHDSLAAAVKSLGEVLSAMAGGTNDDESKASTEPDAKSEDRESDKDEERPEEVSVEPEASEDDDDEDILVEAEALILSADNSEEGDEHDAH